jgi:ketosteroid isomerase-like protein
MDTVSNRKTAEKLVASLGGGEPDVTLLTPDATWWAPGRGEFGTDAFLKVSRAFAGMFRRPSTITIHGVTADGDRVAIEAEGHAELIDGRIYNNRYHYLFVFRDGKICHAKLYNDTAHAARIQRGA